MVKDIREVLYEVQSVMPDYPGVVKINSYYKVLSMLNDREFAIWVLRNHMNSMFMLKMIEKRFSDENGKSMTCLSPRVKPMSFREIGKLIGISEKKVTALNTEIHSKIMRETKLRLDIDYSIAKLLNIRSTFTENT